MHLIAHRGASRDAPENTVGAIELAWRQGADGVEIDVHLTADGRIAVIHDPTTRRTAGRRWRVADRTLAELQTLSAGRKKGATWKGECIPSLDQVLETVPPGKRLWIEVKCGPEIVPELRRVLAALGRSPEQTPVISFHLPVLEAVKAALPGMPVFWLRDRRRRREKRRPWADRLRDWAETCLSRGFQGLDLAWRTPIPAEMVDKLHRAGLELYLWTVNSPRVARRLAALGIDGITTDRPGWLRERLGKVESGESRVER